MLNSLDIKWLKELKDSNDLDNREFYISYLVELREICQQSKIPFNLDILNKLIENYEL